MKLSLLFFVVCLAVVATGFAEGSPWLDPNGSFDVELFAPIERALEHHVVREEGDWAGFYATALANASLFRICETGLNPTSVSTEGDCAGSSIPTACSEVVTEASSLRISDFCFNRRYVGVSVPAPLDRC